MTSDDSFFLFLLPVELLLQIPYAVAMSFVGFLNPIFESLDFLSTFCEISLKSLGLVPGESVSNIAESILPVGVTLGFRFARLLLSLGGEYRHDCDMKVRCLLVHVEMRADIPHFPAIATPSAVVKLSGNSERTASCNSVNSSSLMMPCTFDAVVRKYSTRRKALSTVSTSISFFSPSHSVDELWND